jgi:hypothetical protein
MGLRQQVAGAWIAGARQHLMTAKLDRSWRLCAVEGSAASEVGQQALHQH